MKKLISLAAALFVCLGASAQTADEVNAKFNEAGTLLNAKNFAAAIPALEETIKMATASSDDVAETLTQAKSYLVKALLASAGSDAGAQKFDSALSSALKAKEIAGVSDPLSEERAAGLASKIYQAQASGDISADKYAEAAEKLEKAVALNNKDTKAMILAGQCFGNVGNLDKAGEYYSMVVALEGTHSKYDADVQKAKDLYTSDLLVAASKNDAYDAASALIKKAIEVNPKSPEANILLLQVATKHKKYDDVLSVGASALEALTSADDLSNANFFIAVAEQNKGNNDKAIAAYKKVTTGPNAAAAKAQVTALSAAK